MKFLRLVAVVAVLCAQTVLPTPRTVTTTPHSSSVVWSCGMCPVLQPQL